jgi:integrase/recombinase XerD
MKELPIVTLKRVRHRSENQICLEFDYNEDLILIAKTSLCATWSMTLKCWYIKNNPKNLKLIFSVFKGNAFIDSSALFKKEDKPKVIIRKGKRDLTPENKQLLNAYYRYLKGKRYSKSTINIYTFFIADLIAYYNTIKIELLDNRAVEQFVENVFIKRHYSISTHRQFVSAVKLFAKFYPHCKIDELQLQRPKKSRKLPTVLSQEEVIDIIRRSQNLKHRAIIALIYSCGLRISELLNLKLNAINIDRRQLIVKSGKGRKDRYVVLAESFLPLLQNYFLTYKPTTFFVEGLRGKPYSASSVRKFLHRYCKMAKINKTVTPHTLRHSYATHLLEQGVDLRYIQELLGHAKPETTMIYTHVARKDLLDIRSPLDTALASLTKTQKGEQKFLLSRNIN